MWNQQEILEAQLGMESRYETEEWNQGAKEDLGNVPGRQKLKSEVRTNVWDLLTYSSVLLCPLLAFPKPEAEEEPFGDCLLDAMKTCNNFSISSGLSFVTQQISEPPTS